MVRQPVIVKLLKGLKNLSDNRRNILGQKGEDLAAEHLRKGGYRLIERNYRNNYGEIDIIALDLSLEDTDLGFHRGQNQKK